MYQNRSGWLDNSLLRALASPRQVDDYLGFFNPLWARHDGRARVMSVRHHGVDAVSLRLAPGKGWRQGIAGQHVLLGVEIDGVRQQRCFSLSDGTRDGEVEVTIKRNGVGRVSNHLVDQVAVGDLLWLGRPEGNFVLPVARPQQLLFVAGGSGITPLMAMARQLANENYQGELVFLCFAKSEQSFIFKDELAQLAKRMPNFRIVHILTQQGGRHCDASLLREHVVQPEKYSAFLCGPEAMMEQAQKQLAAVGVADVHQEHFVLSRTTGTPGDGLVQFQASGISAAGDSAGSLLEVAEKAGLSPQYGCRMGICHSCTCKVSGSIRDLRNGELKTVDDQDVQICVHAAAGSVTVAV